ncbi:MAG: hypothetical protein R2831_03750 [Chitinophagaceae bacterium]
MKQLLLILFISTLSLCACKKKTISKPDLPPATQTGAFTFGCYIDGKPYSTAGEKIMGVETYAYFSKIKYGSNVCLTISTSREEPNQDFYIGIRYKDMETMDYEVGEDFFEFQGLYGDYSNSTVPTGSNLFETDSTHTLKIHFNKFTGFSSGGILAGTFSGSMINKDGTVIQVTDGRFDLSLQ